MSCAKVLQFISRKLDGRVLTASSLKSLAAIEKAGERIGRHRCSLDAAALASVVPDTDIDAVGSEFDEETARVFAQLRLKRRFSRVVLEAAAARERNKGDEACCDAAVAVAAAEAAVARGDYRTTVMQTVDRMTTMEEDPARKALLVDLSELLSAPEPAEERKEARRKGVLSISIDIGGSTQAKTRMRARALDSGELTEWYRKFHRDFLVQEWRFYESLFRDDSHGACLDWKRAFVVKGIGDEVWLLYEVVEEEEWNLPGLATRLVDSALKLSSWEIFWTSARDEADEFEDDEPESQRLPLKVYIDFIEDAFEIAGPRLDYLSDQMAGFFDSEEVWRGGESAELANRLNAGTLMADGRRLLATTRTDYIGWEIDRFFRVTKFAIPNVVTVGANLFERILHESEHVYRETCGGNELRRAVIQVPRDPGRISLWWNHDFFYVKSDIPAAELKGVDEAYRVYRVGRKYELYGLYAPDLDEATMKPVRRVFSRAMVKALRKAEA